MTEYRKAALADIDRLVEIRVACEWADHESLSEAEEASLKVRYSDYVSRHIGQDYFNFVAVDDGLIVASAALIILDWPLGHHWQNNTKAYMLHVYTDPAYRRQGHAKRLCQMLIDLAQEHGAAVIELVATEPGQPVYLQLGFHEVDDGCIRMDLPLAGFGL